MGLCGPVLLSWFLCGFRRRCGLVVLQQHLWTLLLLEEREEIQITQTYTPIINTLNIAWP
jgi:hypothetical protein